MTLDQATDFAADDDADQAASAPKKASRRRATRRTAPPPAVETGASPVETAPALPGTETASPEAEPPAEKPATRARKPRRATRAVNTTPTAAGSGSGEPVVTAPADSAADEVAAADEPAPAKRPARVRKATSKASAAKTATGATAETPDVSPAKRPATTAKTSAAKTSAAKTSTAKAASAKSAAKKASSAEPVLDVLGEFGLTQAADSDVTAQPTTVEPVAVQPRIAEPTADPADRAVERAGDEMAAVEKAVAEKSKRTSRRASAPATQTTEPAAAQEAEQKPAAKRTRSRRASIPELELDLPSAPSRSRTRRATSAKPATTDPAEAASNDPASDTTSETTIVETSQGASHAEPEPEPVTSAVTEPAIQTPEPSVPDSRPRRARGRRAVRVAGSTPATAGDSAKAPDVTEEPATTDTRAGQPPAQEEPEAATNPESSAASTTTPPLGAVAFADAPVTPAQSPAQAVGGTPRLATTALLFQAPVPTAAPQRPRRSSTPARNATPAHSGPSTKADPQAEVLALNEVERAAVDEVERIESELVAEGIELPTDSFGPQDYLDDEDAAEDGDQVPADASPEGSEDDDDARGSHRRRRRGGRGRRSRADETAEAATDTDTEPADDTTAEPEPATVEEDASSDADESDGSSRRRRRRRRGSRAEAETSPARGRRERTATDEVTGLKGSTRLEAKRQRRRDGRDAGRRRQVITEAEFLARRESVERSMVVRERDGRKQIAVLEDGVLVEHYVSQQSQVSMAGNVYLGRVQNVLPSMEAAFIDVGKGRNAVLYAGEVNWDAAGLEGQPRRIEQALKSGDSVLVQVTKDPIGHKGARLTSQVTLAGRYLVLVPGGGMTGISRKLPDTERTRLKKILRDIVPEGSGVIVRTAAEGASEDELKADVERLQSQWAAIEKKAKTASAPALLQGEPDLAIRVVRDIFNDDFSSLIVQGENAWTEISGYVDELAPDLRERVSKWTGTIDVFTVHRVDEQLAKGMDRKVWLPSGGSLVIDRTEAMTVVDVNTGKFTGSGGTLEETVTRNNLEAAEEIVRQLRLRDIGGIIVIDFIDMVLESNRDLVLRRLVECLGRDRTRHQVAEVTSLGLVQMTRKRVGQGLVEAFSETCEHCHGRGFIVHTDPIEKPGSGPAPATAESEQPESTGRSRAKRKRVVKEAAAPAPVPVLPEPSSQAREAVKATLATIAAAAAHAHDQGEEYDADGVAVAVLPESEGAGDTQLAAGGGQEAAGDDDQPSPANGSDSQSVDAGSQTGATGSSAQVEPEAGDAPEPAHRTPTTLDEIIVPERPAQ